MELSEIFDQFPAFQKWAENKKLAPPELDILTEFNTSQPLKPLLRWLETRQPTHSQGAQILELGGELLLMNKPLDSRWLNEAQAPELIKKLQKLRLAETSRRDEKKSKIVQSLSWPPSIQAQWIRQGDRGALSVQFKSFSLKDFQQKIQKLNSVYSQLSQAPEKLWKDPQ